MHKYRSKDTLNVETIFPVPQRTPDFTLLAKEYHMEGYGNELFIFALDSGGNKLTKEFTHYHFQGISQAHRIFVPGGANLLGPVVQEVEITQFELVEYSADKRDVNLTTVLSNGAIFKLFIFSDRPQYVLLALQLITFPHSA